MASHREYLDFVLEQLSEIEGVSARPMMGEYIICCRGVLVGGVYDDRFLVKPTPSARRLMPGAAEEVPYPGAKPMLLADIDDRELMKRLIPLIAEEQQEKRGGRARRKAKAAAACDKGESAMLDEKGFDSWAGSYDDSVRLSDEGDSYPFAGYNAVLRRIFGEVTAKEGASVLDIGFGTAKLPGALYRRGHAIFGQDFSERMLGLARESMPRAELYLGDFSKGLAAPLLKRRYDFIIATYSLHHLTAEEKTPFIRTLLGLLEPGGALLIGDVAFADEAEQLSCRERAGEEWDETEHYFIADDFLKEFPSAEFEKISFCAGVFRLRGGK